MGLSLIIVILTSAALRTANASAAYLAGMLTSAAFSVHPLVLPAIGDPHNALTIDNAAAPASSLRIGLLWWVPGVLRRADDGVVPRVPRAIDLDAE